MFQFFQLFGYHIDLFLAKQGNAFYGYKKIGVPTPKFDKCIFGVLVSSIIISLIAGPFIMFSDYGGLI